MNIKKMVLLGIVLAIDSHAGTQSNALYKVFHHRRSTENIEVGSVAFYFAQHPKLHASKAIKVASDQEERVFHFKGTTVPNVEIKRMIQDFNAGGHTSYAVKIEHDHGDNCIKFVCRYNPQKIDMQYDIFESVGLEKGLVFRFINKEVVKHLENKRSSVLSTAWANKVPEIVIDCGHGGTDSGASVNGLQEKELTMRVGLEVAELLKKKGFRVSLTRDSDLFVPLDQRTSFANALNADLFVSIHANFAANKNAAGLETYCLSERLFTPQFSTLDPQACKVVSHYTQNAMKQGYALAHAIHHKVITNAMVKNPRIADRKIAQAVTQVLLGSQMPAVLVELGFLSNPFEAQLLKDDTYQRLLALGICEGIASFAKINA